MEVNYLNVIVFGLIGGFIHCLLNGFVKPYAVINQKRKIFNLGFCGQILLGGFASLLIFMLGANETLSIDRVFGMSILSGIGGGSIIRNVLEKRQILNQNDQIKIANNKINNSYDTVADLTNVIELLEKTLEKSDNTDKK